MWKCCCTSAKVLPKEAESLPDGMVESDAAAKAEAGWSGTDEQIEATTRVIGDYVIHQTIGQGYFGMATIQLASQKGVVVVLRQFNLDQLGIDEFTMLQNEMCVAQLVSHSNLATYVTSFVHGYHLWAIQELMHYGSCADVMHSAAPFQQGFGEPMISIVLRDVLRALHYLHSLGYIHRSVRAKHFLISKHGIVKLSGLRSMVCTIQSGIRLHRVHHHSPDTVNNICWLAPEVLAQDMGGYGKLSDIYSVGIAALELATGEAPYAGLPVTQIMMLKLQGNPPVLMKRGNREVRLSSRLGAIVDRCVDPSANQRPTAYQLLAQSFFKPHKKTSFIPLPELLHPVMPLDTSKL